MSVQAIANSVITASLYSLLAYGFVVTYQLRGFFDFGYGAYVLIGAYLSYAILTVAGIPIVVVALVVPVLVGGLGLLVQELLHAPLANREAGPLIQLLASFGLLLMAEGAIQTIFGPGVLSIQSAVEESLSLGSAVAITRLQLIVVGLAVILLVVSLLVLHSTTLGRTIRAAASGAITSQIVGIDHRKVTRLVVFVGCSVGGLSGGIIAIQSTLRPTMGGTAALKAIVGAILGGLGSVTAGMAGGALLGITENAVVWYVGGAWRDAVALVLLMAVLLVRKTGVFGRSSARRIDS